MGKRELEKYKALLNLKRKKKRSSCSSSTSSSSSLSSIDEETKKKLKRKIKKLKKKEKQKKKKKKEKKALKKLIKTKLKEEDLSAAKFEGLNAASYDVDIGLLQTKNLAPMTKEEWEKQQNSFKRVYDEETGRMRLIKGTGEIVEECVSRERHLAINKQATKGDGEFFQKKLLQQIK